MIRYERKYRLLAMGFAALAGFVDAIGFLKSGGLFVSFMSGNSTRLAIGAANAAPVAFVAASLIFFFILGVILSVLASSKSQKNRKVTSAAIVAFLLVGAASFESLGWDWAVISTLCLAMGASNAVFQREGEVSIGVTYMTGTLVRLGHRIAEALMGGNRTAWLSYLLLWFALVFGGVAGTIVFRECAAASLWSAAVASITLACAVRLMSVNSGTRGRT